MGSVPLSGYQFNPHGGESMSMLNLRERQLTRMQPLPAKKEVLFPRRSCWTVGCKPPKALGHVSLETHKNDQPIRVQKIDNLFDD